MLLENFLCFYEQCFALFYRALSILIHLSLTTTLVKYYYCPYFTNGETEAPNTLPTGFLILGERHDHK